MDPKTDHEGDTCLRRPYREEDKPDLYQICLRTGNAGEDASEIFHDSVLLGDLYVGPYLEYQSELAWTVEDDQGIGGYVLGIPDTITYQRWFRQHWLPIIRKNRQYPVNHEEEWTMDDALLASLFEFEFYQPDWLDQYPAHIHIDLLPRLQGQGLGSRLVKEMLGTLLQHGCIGVHLGMHPENLKALHFYRKLGFSVIEQIELKWEEVLY